MTTTPRVTVLMTVYNGLPYLPQAIESVLNQTFTDFEFVIIDDASTDGSVACIRRYADPRIRLWCNERNLGQASSLNTGLTLSRAPYIARMDQDDICLPDRLRQQVNLLEARPDIAAVGTLMYWLRANGDIVGVVGLKMHNCGAFLGTLLSTASPLGHSTVMYRRDIVADAGGYDVSFAPCEDYELWCRLALRGYRASVIPEPLVMLRIHGQQQSITRSALQRQHVRRAHERFVTTWCQPNQARLVSSLLQLNEAFWEECRSQGAVWTVLQALDGTLDTMRITLGLNHQEDAALRRCVSWWLGRCAFMAILQRHRQSLPVYLFALQGGIRALSYPAILAYPGCFAFAPLFVPRVRETLVRLARTLNQQRYVLRLLGHGLKSRLSGIPLLPKGSPWS